jgi:tRNA U38,U39,U40 pseudouridine synthase TruA
MQSVGRGVFQYTGGYAKLCETQDLPSHIALRKARSIPKVREARKSDAQARTYALVTYRFKNPTAQQKKTVERLKRRAIAARLRPSVLLFPHIRAGESRKRFGQDKKRPPLGSRDFAQSLSRRGAEVWRWTRLRLANQTGQGLINRAIESTISSDIDSLESKIRTLRTDLGNDDASTKKLRTRLADLRRRYKDLKMISTVVKNIWGHNADERVRRLYDLLLVARRRISMNEN